MRPLLVALVLCVATPAHAVDWQSIRFATSMEMTGRAATTDPRDGLDATWQGTWGVAARALVGKKVHYAAAIDFEVGFEVPGGFAYGFHLLPVGLGFRLGKRGLVGVAGGVGLGGVIDRVPFGGEFPVDAFLEFDLGKHVRFHSGARATWVAGSAARDGGIVFADLHGLADELDLRAGLSFGTRESEYGYSWGDFTYFGITWREQVGERIVGVCIALSIAGAGGGRR